jgi:hypothetical protein
MNRGSRRFSRGAALLRRPGGSGEPSYMIGMQCVPYDRVASDAANESPVPSP